MQASLDNRSDASSALLALGAPSRAPGLLFVPPGTFQVQRSVDLNKPLVLQKGSVLVVASGATLTLNQPLNSGPWQVFSGAGAVRFKTGSVAHILPEWFGEACCCCHADKVAEPACLPACMHACMLASCRIRDGCCQLFARSLLHRICVTGPYALGKSLCNPEMQGQRATAAPMMRTQSTRRLLLPTVAAPSCCLAAGRLMALGIRLSNGWACAFRASRVSLESETS